MFYVLVFSLLAVVLIVGGIAAMTRRRRFSGDDGATASHTQSHATHNNRSRQIEKAKRAQSQHARRKRH